MANFAPKPRVTVTQKLILFLAFPDLQILDLVGPLQVFASANEAALDFGASTPPYSTRVVSRHGGDILSSAGLSIATQPFGAIGGAIDTLIVAGGAGVHKESLSAGTIEWVSHHAGEVRRLCSVCTGAFLLAAAGALEGKRATTHWSAAKRLQREHPAVKVDAHPIFLRDGNVWTSAGITAGIDLALALIEQDCGTQIAMEVAKRLVVFLKRPAGQSQFSGVLQLQDSSDPQFSCLNAWIGENLSSALRVETLAEKAAMSPRSFARRYRAATGVTPAKAVEQVRVEAARCLLETSTLPVKAIASGCGFGDEERLRRSFHRVLGTSPSKYRTLFGRVSEVAE